MDLKWLKYFIYAILIPASGYTQICGSGTPSFTIDLTGNADSIWTSVSVVRDDTCCGATFPDKCIQFLLTLDSNAYGIKFDIIKGALPPGALYYQISCGPPVAVGDILCLTGPGPHHITFCKPGNNQNIYQISSIGKPDISDGLIITEACNGVLFAEGYDTNSVTWTTSPFDSIAQSFLSCSTKCLTTYLNATFPFPDSAYYKVCGTFNGCVNLNACDSVLVQFVTNLEVNIFPDTAKVCYGTNTITLTANPTGGKSPYKYEWSTTETTQSIQASPGQFYSVIIYDSTNCSPAYDTVYVDSFTLPIRALAGPDLIFCKNEKVVINGSIQAADGGIWSGGNGSYIDSDTSLNLEYTPSTAELASGSLTLKLTTTGNYGCPRDSDYVKLSFTDTPQVQISGPDTICQFGIANYSTTYNTNYSYQWSVIGGIVINPSPNSNKIQIQWTDSTDGYLSVNIKSGNNCFSKATYQVWVLGQEQNSILGPDSTCQNNLTNLFQVSPFKQSSNYNWSATNATITKTLNDSIVIRNSRAFSGMVNLEVIATNIYGCKDTAVKNVFIVSAPDSIIYGPDTICELTTASYNTQKGHSYAWTTTNGTIVKGSGTDSIRVFWPVDANSHTLALTTTNSFGCVSTSNKNIVLNARPDSVIYGPDTLCELTAASYTAPSGSSFSWTITNGSLLSGTGTDSIRVFWPLNTNNHSIQLDIENSFGCKSDVSKDVVLNARPDSVIYGPDSICELSPAQFSASAGTSHTWTLNNGTLVSGLGNDTIQTFWANNTNNHSLSVNIKNAFGCESNVAKNLIINEKPDSTIIGTDTLCELTTASYKCATGDNYSWTASNGTIVSGTGTDSIAVFWPVNSNNHAVSVVISNTNGCSSTVSMPVILNARPDSVITGPDTLCELTAANYIASAGTAHSWTLTNGTISSGTGNDSITVFWPVNANNHLLDVTITNAFGCTSNAQKAVFLNPRPDSIIYGPDTLCELTTASYNTQKGHSYVWTATNGTIVKGSGTDSIRVFWPVDANSHTLALTTTNSFGCVSTSNKNIVLNTRPDSVIYGPDTLCELTAASYTAPSGSSFSWTITNGSLLSGTGTDSIRVFWPLNTNNHSIQLDIENSFGCKSDVSKDVVLNARPDSVIYGPDSICELSPAQFSASAGTSHTWTLNNGTLVAGLGNDTIQTFWANNTNNHSLSVNIKNAFGCESNVAKNLIINEKPDSTIIGTDTLCELTTASYKCATGDNYSWTASNGTIVSGTGTDSIAVFWPVNSNNHAVSVVISNTNGCSSTVSMPVILNARPDSVITGPDTLCELTAANYIASAGTAHSWTLTNGTISSGTGNDSITVFWPVNANNHLLDVTITNVFGCTSNAQKAVFLNPRPDSIIYGPDTLCELTTASYNTQKGHSYVWTATNGTIVKGSGTDSIRVFWPVDANSHTLALTTTNSFGCVSTSNKNIVLNTRPDSVIYGPDTLCELTAASYTAPSGSSFSWTITNGSLLSGTGTDSIRVFWPLNTNNHSIQLDIENSFGCKSDVSKDVVLNARPDSVIYGPDSICELSPAQFSASAGTSHTWTLNNGTLVSGLGNDTIQTFWANNTNNHSLSVNIKNAFGCESNVAKNLIINEKPDSTIIGTDTLCELTTASYKCATGDNYSWTASNGTIVSGTGTDSIAVFWPVNSNNHAVSVVISNTNGCSSTVSMPVILNARPDSVITGPDTLCELTAANYIASAGTAHSWTLTNGTISSGTGNDSITVFWPVNANNHLLDVTITNVFGCTSNAQKAVFLNPRPDSIIYGPDTLCELTTASYNTQKGHSYVWTATNGTIVKGSGTDSIRVFWPVDANSHTLALTTTNSFGCMSTSNKNIVLNTRPDSVIYGPDTLCELTAASYTAPSGSSFSWTITNGTLLSGTGTDSIRVFWPLNTNNHSIQLDIENSFGCKSDASINVILNARPKAIINGPDSICENSKDVYTTNKSANYAWSITNGNIRSGFGTNKINVSWPGKSVEHKLAIKLTNQFGCTDTSSKKITVFHKPDSTILGPDSICELSTAKYSILNNDNIEWNITNGKIEKGQNSDSIEVSWPRKQSIHLIAAKITNVYGCSSNGMKTVIVNAKPDSFIMGPDSLCENDVARYFSDNAVKIDWKITNGKILNNSKNDSILVKWPNNLGIHNLEVSLINSYGCKSKATKEVRLIGKPDTLITGPDSLCELTNAAYRVKKSYTLQWKINGGTINGRTNLDSVKISWPRKALTHQISVDVTNSIGCKATGMKNIHLHPKPDSLIFGPLLVCELDEADYYVKSGNTFNWKINNGSFISSNTIDSVSVQWPLINNLGNSKYGLEVAIENIFGCKTIGSKEITLKPTPMINIKAARKICFNTGDTLAIKVESSIKETDYTWSYNGFRALKNKSNDSLKYGVLENKIAYFNVSGITKFGCENVDTHSIEGLFVGSVKIEGPDSVCTYQTKTYTIKKAHNFLNLRIYVRGGNLISNTSDSLLEISWDSIGNKGYIYVNAFNKITKCDTNIIMEIAKFESPEMRITGPGELCAFSIGRYKADFNIMYDYLWSINQNHKANMNNLRVNWAKKSDSIYLTVTHKKTGCIVQTNHYTRMLKMIDPSIIGDSMLCENDLEQTFDVENSSNATYKWTTSNGKISGADNSSSVNITVDKNGTYISLFIKDNNSGCDTVVRKWVDVSRIKTVTPNDTILCGNDHNLQFTASSNDEKGTFTWDFDDGSILKNGKIVKHRYVDTGEYIVKVQATSFEKCLDKKSFTIRILPNPIAMFEWIGSNDSIYEKEDSVAFINTSKFAKLNNWDFGNDISSTQKDTVIVYDTFGLFTVWLHAYNESCHDSFTLDVPIDAPIKVYPPTAFSPNGDGINVFFVLSGHHLKSIDRRIFNGWGELIYSTTDPDFKWDGTFKGEVVRDDKYLWKATVVDDYNKSRFLDGAVFVIK